MNSSYDSLQLAFFGAAAILVLVKTWQGWQMGIARQGVNILALVAAYVVGYFAGGSLVPILHPIINAPERALGVISAAVVGLGVYFGVSIMGKVLFKKTSQQSVGLVRFGYGISGGAVGALYGVFLVWIAVLTIRLLGSVAETRVAVGANPQVSSGKPTATPEPAEPAPSAMVRGLAHMKESLEQGAAGSVVQQVDPIPGTLYGILHKLGMMVSDDHSVERFLSYPGVKPLLANPKIAALQNDPDIARDLMNRDYFGLLRNSHILAAANDSEIGELMRKFEFEKALDYAIRKPEKEPAKARE
jgi:Colicin V production protein